MPLDGSEFNFEIDETTKLLMAARERIERGWCQGAGRSREGVCAIVALADAAEPDDREAFTAAHLLMSRIVGGGLSDWNDAPGRTKEEILVAFDRAIAG